MAYGVCHALPPAAPCDSEVGRPVREIIKHGPPEELVATFHKLFDEKIKNTKTLAAELAKRYGLLPGLIQ